MQLVCLASAPAVQAASTTTAYAAPAPGLSKVLQGRASLTNDTWSRYFNAGTAALDKRLYRQAEGKLNAALNELRRRNVNDVRVVQTKEALGRTMLGLEKYDDAERILTDAVLRAGKMGSLADGAKARATEALAETLLARGKVERAATAAREAVAACEKVNEPRALGRAHLTLGSALLAHGLDVDAGESYKKAIAVLEHDGLDEHDLADAQYRYGILLRATGNDHEGSNLLAKALSTYDK
jgi:tetratricopeptide (TPR) repeat protein